MKIPFVGAAWVTALGALITILTPNVGVAWQPQYTQSAEQCVNRVDYTAGTNNVAYPFSRFFNTCNATVTMMITTPGYGNNGPGAPMPGAFMVMGWTDGNPKPTRVFACVY